MKNEEFRVKNSAAAVRLRKPICASLFFFLLFSLFTFTSCSTQKAKWANIRYHNLTCHYNVWWNGNESLKAGREKLYKAAVDDYTQLILPENLGNEEAARSVNPDMDRAIEKGVKGIQKHSIFVKGQEHVPYIKECYLLTAYATFYKQDYTSTANTCNILISQFSGTHAGDEGAVLLARCMTKEKRYSDAEAALDQLVYNLEKGNFTRSRRDKLFMAMVEATVPQEKYKKAVEYIHLAIDASGSRRDKARLTFLLAQIYQKLDKRTVAAKYFHQVLSYAPPYVMEFNARLGEASCADLGHSDLKKLEKQLDAMLHDKKNEEYRDQIYYAKGEMYLGMKDAPKACDNYRLSVAVSSQNQAQKAKSALRMAEVLYDLYENYDLAQIYYDTAMQIIKPDYPHYSQIRRRHAMLTELVSFTRVYERADSLIAVAAMPEAERLALISAKIDTLRRHEEEAKEKALLAELMADNKAQQNTLSGDWYFYNPNTVQKGKESFRQRWGLRSLEDYWFLTNRSMIGINPMSDDQEPSAENLASDTSDADLADSTNQLARQSTGKYGNPDDPHDVAFYLKDLPASQQQLDSLDSLTSASLLGAAYIFYDGVGNINRALECYLRLANEYTSYDQIVQAFYMLYRIFDRQGNTPQANYYRDMVLLGFPDSDFANLIRDNEYYRQLLAREKRVESDYEQLYADFSSRRHSAVISAANQAEELYPGNPLLPKFRFLKGLSLAATGRRQEAITVFEQLVGLSPDSIAPLAQAQLDRLRSDARDIVAQTDETITPQDEQRARDINSNNQTIKQSNIVDDDLPPEALVYRFRERQQYYVVIIINDRTVKATELQYRIADFNSQYYANSGYKVNALLFTDTTQLLTVHRFSSADEAMGYYRHLGQDESPLRQLATKDYTHFIISTQNYATFYNRKNIPAYMAYFRKYHLKN